MSGMLATDAAVRLELDDRGLPARLVWRGTHYRVSDQPTPLEIELPILTHPPTIYGWRFQATDDSGDARVFDVIRVDGRAEWRVVQTYV
jgi:hypothetical protein